MNTASVPGGSSGSTGGMPDKTLDGIAAPFDLARVRRMCEQYGYDLVFTSCLDPDRPNKGIWDIQISPDTAATVICASYCISGFWYVYLGDTKAYNEFSPQAARDYAMGILDAAAFTDLLNSMSRVAGADMITHFDEDPRHDCEGSTNLEVTLGQLSSVS